MVYKRTGVKQTVQLVVKFTHQISYGFRIKIRVKTDEILELTSSHLRIGCWFRITIICVKIAITCNWSFVWYRKEIVV